MMTAKRPQSSYRRDMNAEVLQLFDFIPMASLEQCFVA
jgi:hypothetical protein